MKLKLDKETSKKIISLTLATTMTFGALSGCNSNTDSSTKKNLLSGTILENSRVITFADGHIDIAVENSEEYNGYRGSANHKHNHYKSIITNEKFSSTECDFTMIDYKYEITNNESIVIYLTPEEISKASSNELSSEDIKNIVLRIFTEHEEEINKTQQDKTYKKK